MPNNTAIPRDDAGKLVLLQHLNGCLPSYAGILEVSADDLKTFIRLTSLQAAVLTWLNYRFHFLKTVLLKLFI